MTELSSLSTPCEVCFRTMSWAFISVAGGDSKIESLQKKENPATVVAGFSGKDPGDDLLSHRLGGTTIGAAAFHFRVRDGIGWFHSAKFTRETFGASPSKKADEAPVSHDSCDVACTWMHIRRCRMAKAT